MAKGPENPAPANAQLSRAYVREMLELNPMFDASTILRRRRELLRAEAVGHSSIKQKTPKKQKTPIEQASPKRNASGARSQPSSEAVSSPPISKAAAADAKPVKASTAKREQLSPQQLQRLEQRATRCLEKLESEFYTLPSSKLKQYLEFLCQDALPGYKAKARQLVSVARHRVVLVKARQETGDAKFAYSLQNALISPPAQAGSLKEQYIESLIESGNVKKSLAGVRRFLENHPEIYDLERDWFDTLLDPDNQKRWSSHPGFAPTAVAAPQPRDSYEIASAQRSYPKAKRTDPLLAEFGMFIVRIAVLLFIVIGCIVLRLAFRYTVWLVSQPSAPTVNSSPFNQGREGSFGEQTEQEALYQRMMDTNRKLAEARERAEREEFQRRSELRRLEIQQREAENRARDERWRLERERRAAESEAEISESIRQRQESLRAFVENGRRKNMEAVEASKSRQKKQMAEMEKNLADAQKKRARMMEQAVKGIQGAHSAGSPQASGRPFDPNSPNSFPASPLMPKPIIAPRPQSKSEMHQDDRDAMRPRRMDTDWLKREFQIPNF